MIVDGRDEHDERKRAALRIVRADDDPEVVADLALRESTARTRSPSSAEWQSPAIVAAWKCRFASCAIRVPVTQDALDTLAVFNAELSRRGEAPISTTAIVVCERHAKLACDEQASRVAARTQRIRDNVRALRDASDPLKLPDVIAELRHDHHPDVDGLLAALAGDDKRSKQRGKL